MFKKINKVIIWISHEANLSGANICMLEYIDVLRDNYNIIVIIPHEGDFQRTLIAKNIKYEIIRQYNWILDLNIINTFYRLKINFRNSIAFLSYVCILLRLRPDFVFTNTIVTHIGARVAKLFKIKHFWWIHEYGDKDFNIKINWGDIQAGYKYIDCMSFKVITNSLDVNNYFSKFISINKLVTIYQPVSISETEANVLKKDFTFLMFGQISDAKNISLVLDSFSKAFKENIYPIRIDIYGPCENIKYLKSLYMQIEELGIQDAVSLNVGFFRSCIIMPQYRYLINASKSEAFGRSVVEAQKYGVCPIVRNFAGVKELIGIDKGILFETFEDLSILMSEIDWTASYSRGTSYEETTEVNKLFDIINFENR
jgi:glycosyltransferase involved in cell wall biosynthesis